MERDIEVRSSRSIAIESVDDEREVSDHTEASTRELKMTL